MKKTENFIVLPETQKEKRHHSTNDMIASQPANSRI